MSRPSIQFRLRTLLVVVELLCAAAWGVAWMDGQIRIVEERRDWIKKITDRGGTVDEWHDQGSGLTDAPRIPWYRRLLGDKDIFWIMPWRDLGKYNNKEMEDIQKIFPEAGIKKGL